MQVGVSYRSFTDGKNRSHFLLKEATLAGRVSMANGSNVDVAGVKGNRPDLAFSLDLTPALLPAQMTRLELTFDVPVTLDGKVFPTLRIGQLFTPTPAGPDGVATADYRLTPAGWRDSLARLRVSNMATHPLVDASQLPANKVVLNALVLDLTDAWMHLHRNNINYQRRELLSTKVTSAFKVLAHLGGNPLIWYSSVPAHLRGTSAVSPHVFFSPADNTEAQNNYDEEKYLRSNTRHFEADGSTLFNYLTAPVPDVDVDGLKPTVPSVVRRRNVVGFSRPTDKNGRTSTTTITTNHWMIGAGFEKVFSSTGGGKPAQFLLMPQRPEGGSNGSAVTTHLKAATDAIVDLLQTNTVLLSGAADQVVTKSKMILSAYSESGFDLWFASNANQDQIKAIVAIEPQNLNSIQNDYRTKDDAGVPNPKEQAPLIGKDVIPILLKKQVAVFVIGRHHLHYRPQIPDVTKVRLLPAKPAVVLAYPPDPAGNDFVKYRVQRVVDPASDPFLLPEEKAILDSLTARGITGTAALAAVFTPLGNQDATSVGTGIATWYSHQFALSGGEEMTLDPSGIYNKPVTYRTFFEAAVAEIG